MSSLAASVTLAHNLGLISPRTKPILYFWAALERVAPEIYADKLDFQARLGSVKGFDFWADKYGIPMRAKASEVGGKTWVSDGRTDITRPSPGPYSFTFPSRQSSESTMKYFEAFDKANAKWREEIEEEENKVLQWKASLVFDFQTLYHAEWFVLNRLKGLSYEEIAALYRVKGVGEPESVGSLRAHHESIPKHLDKNTVGRAVRRCSNYFPKIDYQKNKGGRPKKTEDTS